jgi:hypothetical protein
VNFGEPRKGKFESNEVVDATQGRNRELAELWKTRQ